MSDRRTLPASTRIKIEDALERLIALLDRVDADPEAEDDGSAEPESDDEPSLGTTSLINQEKAWQTRPQGNGPDLEFDGDTVADADAEPSMGSLGDSGHRTQAHWATGATDDREDDGDDLEPDVDDEPELGSTETMNQESAWRELTGWLSHNDGEPSLGATEQIDQSKWGRTGTSDRELAHD